MKPRIFVSAVTKELGTIRQQVANTLLALGYEPVWQDIFETSPDDLRLMLRKKIDRCKAVIQIIGSAYGAEPPQPDETFGRCSYTQYEAKYAKSKGKDVYCLIMEPEGERDEPAEQIDVAKGESKAALEDLKNRQKLQKDYLEERLNSERVYYRIRSRQDAELRVFKLRSDMDRYNSAFASFMSKIKVGLVLVIVVTILNTCILFRISFYFDSELYKSELVKQVTETYQRSLKEARKLETIGQRYWAEDKALEQQQEALRMIDETIERLQRDYENGTLSADSMEFNRIIQEEGTEKALQWISTQKERILQEAFAIIHQQQQQKLTQKLDALYFAAERFYADKNYEQTIAYTADILSIQPYRTEVIHLCWLANKELFDNTFIKSGTRLARPYAEKCLALAQDYVRLKPDHQVAHRDPLVSYNKLGNLLVQEGNIPAARQQYVLGLEISLELAEDDPTNQEAQNDLSISYEKIGGIYLELISKPINKWTQFGMAFA